MDAVSASPAELEEEFSQDPPEEAAMQSPPFAAGEGERTPLVVPSDVVTRLLCATVHLKGGFADHVLGELVEPAHRAMAPNWNIDTGMLVRHAQQASRRRMLRDTRLLAVFALLFLLQCLWIASAVTGRVTVSTAAVLTITIWVLAYGAAFAIVWWHYSLIHRSAIGVIGIPGVDAKEPDPLDPEVAAALAESDESNAILFSGSSPFVGSGQLLDRWTVTVDIGTGAERPDGGREVPEEFDNLELHEALAAAIPRAIGPDPVVGHRLYVVGGHAISVGGLFRHGPVPDDGTALIRFRRPVPSVPEEMIKRYMREPAASARPYTFFELTAWDGQVVVTLFVRVLITYPTLFVEMAVCALRPPQGRYGDVGSIRLGEGVHRWPIFRAVLPQTMRLLLGSPVREYLMLRGARRDRLARRDLELTLKERNDVNFSAGPSLREEIARSDNPLHFGFVDEEMFYRMFSQASLECLRAWLVERKIDVTDFDRQRSAITERRMAIAQEIYGID